MSGSLALAIASAAQTLADKSPTARLDAELLAAHLLGLERNDMLLRMRDMDAPDGLSALVERRARGEPIAYITGNAEFWSLPLIVTPETLIPRPDSETLIETAAKAFMDRNPPARILDLGTGTGALLAAALTLFPRAAGIGIDASVGAANVATGNMKRLDLAGRAEILVLDWTLAGWRDLIGGPFDLILCNPPYIADDDAEISDDVRDYEPANALFAADHGLVHYRHLIPELPLLLTEEGVALFEIGYRQGAAVMNIGREAGMAIALHHDLAGLPRCVQFTNGAPGDEMLSPMA